MSTGSDYLTRKNTIFWGPGGSRPGPVENSFAQTKETEPSKALVIHMLGMRFRTKIGRFRTKNLAPNSGDFAPNFRSISHQISVDFAPKLVG